MSSAQPGTSRVSNARAQRVPRGVLAALLLGALLAPLATSARAQDLSALYRVLHDGSNFRVRAQAALVIGRSQQASARAHLERALQDDHPTVRAAAASALGTLGEQAASATLRPLLRDRSSEVRAAARRAIDSLRESSRSVSNAHSRAAARTVSAPTRSSSSSLRSLTPPTRSASVDWRRVNAVVILGELSDRSGYSGAQLAPRVRAELGHELADREDIAYFASRSEIDARAQREIRRRHIPQFRVQGHVQSMDRNMRETRVTLRCDIRLVVLDDPGNNLRGSLRGGASGSEDLTEDGAAREARLAQRMVAVSVRSAVGQLAELVANARHR